MRTTENIIVEFCEQMQRKAGAIYLCVFVDPTEQGQWRCVGNIKRIGGKKVEAWEVFAHLAKVMQQTSERGKVSRNKVGPGFHLTEGEWINNQLSRKQKIRVMLHKALRYMKRLLPSAGSMKRNGEP